MAAGYWNSCRSSHQILSSSGNEPQEVLFSSLYSSETLMCRICGIPLVLVFSQYSIYPETDQFNTRCISQFYILSLLFPIVNLLLSVFPCSPPCILPSINLIHPPASRLSCPSFTSSCFLLAPSFLLLMSLMLL